MRLLNWLLLTLALVGAAMVIANWPRLRRLESEQRRLEARIGRLEIRDRSQAAIVAIKTDEPYHFAWRIYSPREGSFWLRTGSVGGQSTLSGSLHMDREIVVRCRFIFENDSVKHFIRSSGSSMTAGLFGAGAADFLESNWDRMIVTCVGQTGTQIIDPNVVTDLLSVTVPPELVPEAIEKLGSVKVIGTEPLVLIRFGTEDAFADEEKRASEGR